MPNPLVSIIIPVFNAAQTLAETLGSAAAQTYEPVEVIIIDDGSTDASAAIASAFCEERSGRHLIVQPNAGVAAARNAGIAAARGEFIAPLDADDLWHPAKIARQVAAARASPEPPGFVYCWSRCVDGRGMVVGNVEALSISGFAPARHAWKNFVGNGSAPLLWRRAVESVGGYDARMREDGMNNCKDLAIQRAIAADFPVACVPEFLVGYRVGRPSMSADPERMFCSWKHVAAAMPAAGPAIRWALAEQSLELAEHRASRGRPVAAAERLAAALLRDPRRTSFYLIYRLARRLAKFWLPPVVEPPRHFADWQPAEPARGDPFRLPAWEAPLRRIDVRRERSLGAIDQTARR